MTIRDLLEMRAGKDGEKPFLYFRDQVVDFATLDRNVNKAANALRELGVKKGDHVCLFMPNRPDFLYVWFGLAKIGGVMVPLNTNHRGDTLKYLINRSDAKWIIVNEALYEVHASVEKDLGGVQVKIWHSEGASPPETFHSLNALMESAEEKAPPSIDIKDGNLLGINCSTGTTGTPKAVMISHFNYLNTCQVWAEDIINYKEDDIFFTTFPLFNVNTQMFTAMGSLFSGCPFVLREKFSPSLFFDEIRQYGATVFQYFGYMLTWLMRLPKREDDADNPARLAFGAAASREILEDFETRFNVKIIEGYGLAETGGVCLCNPHVKIKEGSIGKPTRFCDVTIWDENNRKVSIGHTGMIVVKEKVPYSMFLGYYNQTDKTEEAFEGSWFKTGDRGYKDEEGYFYFVDRLKDCIQRGADIISSLEIEEVVNSHPKVLASAAVAIPSEVGENDIKIYVVLKRNEELNPETLIAFCEEQMASFMVPRYVEYVKELPRTHFETIRKSVLRRRGIGKAWDREKGDLNQEGDMGNRV